MPRSIDAACVPDLDVGVVSGTDYETLGVALLKPCPLEVLGCELVEGVEVVGWEGDEDVVNVARLIECWRGRLGCCERCCVGGCACGERCGCEYGEGRCEFGAGIRHYMMVLDL